MITGVDFILIPVTDFDRAVEFYETVLELPRVKQWGSHPGMEFQAGNLTVAVWDPTFFGQEYRPGATPVAFQVDDVEAVREQLEAKGVEFPIDLIDSGSCHQRIFADPDGNPLILHHIYGR